MCNKSGSRDKKQLLAIADACKHKKQVFDSHCTTCGGTGNHFLSKLSSQPPPTSRSRPKSPFSNYGDVLLKLLWYVLWSKKYEECRQRFFMNLSYHTFNFPFESSFYIYFSVSRHQQVFSFFLLSLLRFFENERNDEEKRDAIKMKLVPKRWPEANFYDPLAMQDVYLFITIAFCSACAHVHRMSNGKFDRKFMNAKAEAPTKHTIFDESVNAGRNDFKVRLWSDTSCEELESLSFIWG